MNEGNEEKERTAGREASQDLASPDSSQARGDGSSRAGGSGERQRHHTPSTFPRTKMSSSMPLSQKLALENLRTHLTFSDGEEVGMAVMFQIMNGV